MIRRVHVSDLKVGSIALDPRAAHHVRDVLRLTAGEIVELFDNAGLVASGKLLHVSSENVVVAVEAISEVATAKFALTVAAAIPKADRADWMVEKLSELGVSKFIPLIAERSVVVPGGKNKIERWERIAIEAAKQSRRIGVMTIEPIASLEAVIGANDGACYLSTEADAASVDSAISACSVLLVGPEGGWSAKELEFMRSVGAIGVGLTHTVLRVETAAVVAAGIFLSHRRFTEVR